MRTTVRSLARIAGCVLSGLLLAVPPPTNAVAAEETSTSGSLQARDGTGRLLNMPLEHTRVSVEVSAFVARATVEQVFRNPFRVPVEAIYTFPLGDTAAVDDYEIVVGSRTIRGEIRRREEARRLYEEARREGYVASILDQERPNVFTQAVANLEPGREVVVRIRTVEVLRYEAGSYELVVPLVVGPRYVPGGGATSVDDDPLISTRNLGTRALERGFRSGHDVEIEVRIEAGVPIGAIESESHEIETARPAPSRAEIRLAPGDRIPNKDFVLRWSVAAEDPELALLAHRTGADGYFTLLVQPKDEVAPEEAAPKEIVLVVDTSGSMKGIPLRRSRSFAEGALRSLASGDTFNLVQFAAGSSVYSTHPIPNRPDEVDGALEWLDGFVGAGGTELMTGLYRAVEQPVEPGRFRMVVVLSDGMLGNEREVLAEVGRLPDDVRVFTVGMGTSVNHSLLRRMAELGGGAYTFVAAESAGDAALERFRKWVTRPYLAGLEIDWGHLPVTDFVPEGPYDLFSGQNLTVVGRYAGAARGEITLRGWLAGRPWEERLEVVLPDRRESHSALGSVWARHTIRHWIDRSPDGIDDDLREEITALALEHRLLSPYTSFVAVDDSVVVNPDGDPATVRQAVPPPRDSGFETDRLRRDLVEKVVVMSHREVVDLTRRSASTRFSDEFIQDLPVPGRYYSNVIMMAPGTPPPADGDGSPRVHRSRARDAKPIVSGVSSVDPLTGAVLGNVASNSIEEMEVVSTGAGVEFGSSQGSFARVVQIQGSNDFEGETALRWGSDLLDGTRRSAAPGAGNAELGSEEVQARVSGPIIRDRLWYRIALEADRRDDPVDVLRGVETVRRDRDLLSGRLTWQAAPRNKLSLQLESADSESDGLQVGSLTRRTAAAASRGRERSAALTWSAAHSPRLFVESVLSWRSRRDGLFPSGPVGEPDCGTEVAGAPFGLRCTDTLGGTIAGGFPLDGSEDRELTELRSRGELYASHGEAKHHLVFGAEWSAERNRRSISRGPELFRFDSDSADPAGLGEVLVARIPVGPGARLGADASRSALFLEDRIEIGSGVVLQFGARFDREEVETGGRDASVTGPKRRFRDDAWSPLASVSWMPGGTDAWKLFTSVRRYHDGLDPAVVLMEGSPEVWDVRVDPLVPAWPATPGAGAAILGIRTVDGLRLPRMDEWSLGLEREIATETLFRLLGVDRRYREQLRLDPAEDGSFLLSNRGRDDVRFYTVEIDRRQYRGWELKASYTWTDAIGDGEAVSPWSLDQAILLVDRPGFRSDHVRHDVKVQGVTITPFGFRFGGSLRWHSGRPFTAYTMSLDESGLHPLLVPVSGERNALRNEPWWDVNLRFTREYILPQGMNLLIAIEVLDLLDDETYTVFNPSLGFGRRIDGFDDAFRRSGRRYVVEVRLRF